MSERRDRVNVTVMRELYAILKSNATSLGMPTAAYVDAVLRDAIKTGSIDAMAIRSAGDHKVRGREDALKWKNIGTNIFGKGPGRYMYIDEHNTIWILEKQVAQPRSNRPMNDEEGWYVFRQGSSNHKVNVGWKIRPAMIEADRVVKQFNRTREE